MAGDWIKVEHATTRKPEVTTIAEMLGVSHRETMGILFDFWVWLDQNACHANVTLVSRKSLDSVLQCEGLAACLEHVGWVIWDDKARSMTVVNYDRHNGESAKNRGLATERKRRQRAKVVTDLSRNDRDISVTREEKRREERIHTAPVEPAISASRSSKTTQCPADFALSPRVMEWALKNGYRDLDQHFAYFMSYVKRKAPKYADWDEAFMNAVRLNWAKMPVVPLRSERVAL